MGLGAQGFEPSSSAFSGPNQESGSEVEQPGQGVVPNGMLAFGGGGGG